MIKWFICRTCSKAIMAGVLCEANSQQSSELMSPKLRHRLASCTFSASSQSLWVLKRFLVKCLKYRSEWASTVSEELKKIRCFRCFLPTSSRAGQRSVMFVVNLPRTVENTTDLVYYLKRQHWIKHGDCKSSQSHKAVKLIYWNK